MMNAYQEDDFSRAEKTITFRLGEHSFRQRASLGVLLRIETKFGPATVLLARLAQKNITITEVAQLLERILRDHADLPKGEALLAAMEVQGVAETMDALALFLRYGLDSDMPPSGERAGN